MTVPYKILITFLILTLITYLYGRFEKDTRTVEIIFKILVALDLLAVVNIIWHL